MVVGSLGCLEVKNERAILDIRFSASGLRSADSCRVLYRTDQMAALRSMELSLDQITAWLERLNGGGCCLADVCDISQMLAEHDLQIWYDREMEVVFIGPLEESGSFLVRINS